MPLWRRFQVVRVEEPTEPVAVEMMQGLVATLEKHHRVRILSEAIHDAVKLSHRYISGRLLPDKSVSLLDTTCARIGLSQSSTPPAVEDAQRTVQRLNVSIGILRREQESGVDHSDSLRELTQQKAAAEENLQAVTERWAKEKSLVAKIHQLYAAVTGTHIGVEEQHNTDKTATGSESAADGSQAPSAAPPQPLTGPERDKALQELRSVEAELAAIQGDHPMSVCRLRAAVETIESWTGPSADGGRCAHTILRPGISWKNHIRFLPSNSLPANSDVRASCRSASSHRSAACRNKRSVKRKL